MFVQCTKSILYNALPCQCWSWQALHKPLPTRSLDVLTLGVIACLLPPALDFRGSKYTNRFLAAVTEQRIADTRLCGRI